MAAIDDLIANAGAQLMRSWHSNERPQQPENNLHPDNAALQFRIGVLESQVTELYALNRRLLNGLRDAGIIKK